MNQQPSPPPNQQPSPPPNQQPDQRSVIILWTVITLIAATLVLGIFAIVNPQDVVSPRILSTLTFVGLLLSIYQVASKKLIAQARLTLKTGLLVIMSLLLIASLAWNINQFQKSNKVSPTAPTRTMIPTQKDTPPPLPALVQKNFQSGANTVSDVKFASTVTAGNLIIVAITQWEGVVTDVTDNLGNSYIPVKATQHANEAHDYVELYYAKQVASGATTVIVRFSLNGDENIGIYEYSGLDTLSPLDQVVSNTGEGNTPDGGALHSTTNNEIYFVVGVDDDGNNSSPVAGNGYTLEDHQNDSSNERFYSEYCLCTHESSQTNFSIAIPSYWAVIGASFKPA